MTAEGTPMVYDTNAWLGLFPYRPAGLQTAAELRGRLQQAGIGRALVAPLHAVYHRHSRDANLALLREIALHRDFFVPALVINPLYPAWRQDFTEAVREWGLKVVRVTPYVHGYRLDDEQGRALLQMAAELGVLVSVPASVENPLQRHRLDADRWLEPEEWANAAAAVPAARMLLHNAATHLYAEEVARRGLPGRNLYYDFQRVDCIADDALERLVVGAGVENVVLGTGAPLCIPEVQRVKLEYLRRMQVDSLAQHLAWDNAKRIIERK